MSLSGPPSITSLDDRSRRRFLTTASATTASAAAAPLLVAAAAQAQTLDPAAKKVGVLPADKAQDLAGETSIDAGQALTTNEGLKISDGQNSLRAGVRGPTLLEDQPASQDHGLRP